MAENIFEYEGANCWWDVTGSGKPLLLLHGWGSNSQLMKPLAESLSSVRTCYLIDLPGFGNSSEPPEAWSVDRYADLSEAFVREIIAQNHEDQKTDLLVHSFGARIALKLLTRQDADASFDKVIFTGAAGLKPKRKPSYYLKKYTAKMVKAPFMILPGNLRDKGLTQLRSTNLWKKLGSSDYSKLSGVMRETFVKSVTEYLDELLPKVSHEILLIWGENDTATPMDQAVRFEKNLPDCALVTISEAGHYAFLDQPAKFTAIARAYLEPASN
ncbi:alpha/beta fold hydrolase [Rhodohalobacter mucosus]|uniref:Alpha/beta hydrolase n=1 Tax=Rhodohalobacter mucosus TaxID=2079485 RepID=A0A316TUP6_9BACT|nr:alpha/beta hydrolase [Rhodohalobacter mucosus]PWN08170.1 alpha/beta hydrolase [Rhodohalobacter mucosus]